MTKEEMADKYKEQRKQYYLKNREKILAQKKEERESNLELYRHCENSYAKKYREENKEKIAAFQKKYHEKRKEKK